MRAVCLFTLVLLLCPEVASAQGQPSFGPSETAAIERLFAGYGKAFVDEDYAKLQEHIQAPFIRFGPSNTFSDKSSTDWVVLRTMDDAIGFFRAALRALKAQGVDVRAQYLETRITALSADRALVNRSYRRSRKDGTVMMDLASVYVVSKSSGSWKICGIMNQDLREFGKVYSL